ncbi:MAG: flippase [bacterium]|nr:flippase [bacterium]
MSLTRKVAHNTIVQIVGKVITTILGLVALGMVTRYLGQEKFGWYITVTAFLQFAGILIDFGMIVVTAQMLSEPFKNKERLFQNLFTFRFFSALLFFSIAPIVALTFPYNTEIKIAIAISSIAFLAITLNQVFVGLYQTKLKMHIYAASEVLSRLIMVLAIYFVIINQMSFLAIMVAILISSVSHTTFLWLRARKETKISFTFDLNIWKSIMIKMWPIALSIMFNVVYLKGDLVLLSIFVDQAQVGIYGAAYRVLDVITQSAMMIMGILMPLMAFAWSRNLKHEFKKHFQQSFDIMMLFAVPLMFGAITLSDRIIQLVAGNEFAESGKILAILAIAVFGVFFGAIFGHTAVAINRQKQTLWIYISNAVITLIGYLIFIPIYGIYGAAWMTVFSELYAGILLYFTIRHYSKERLHLKTTLKIVLASLVMSSSIKLFPSAPVILLVFTGIIVYSSVLILIGGVNIKTIKEIIRLEK